MDYKLRISGHEPSDLAYNIERSTEYFALDGVSSFLRKSKHSSGVSGVSAAHATCTNNTLSGKPAALPVNIHTSDIGYKVRSSLKCRNAGYTGQSGKWDLG